MPFYRIVIWTRKRYKPFQGIREIENQNITVVQLLVRKKAVDHFHSSFLDCEVQMLAKTSTAIKRYLARKSKTKPAYYSIRFRFRKQNKEGQVYVHADRFEVRFADMELIKEFGGLLIFGLDKSLQSSRITDALDRHDLVRAISAELKYTYLPA